MKKYWFFGLGINDRVDEVNLTEPQKQIINQEKNDLTRYSIQKWLGVSDRKNGWFFLKHGLEVEHIPNVYNANDAREILYKRVIDKYNLHD